MSKPALNADRIWKALADSTRREILDALAQGLDRVETQQAELSDFIATAETSIDSGIDARRLRRHEAASVSEQHDQRGLNMIYTDPPKHTRYRRLVNKGFTPRMIGLLEQYLEHCSLGRLGSFAEVARLAVFLLSERCSYLTGETITMDGNKSVTATFSEIPPACRRGLAGRTTRILTFANTGTYTVNSGLALTPIQTSLLAVTVASSGSTRRELRSSCVMSE